MLCGPLVYYELFLLRESTIVFAGLGVVWLADRALTRGSWAWFVVLGLSLGLACLLKSSLVLLGVAVALGIALHFAGRWRELRMPAAATLAGFAIAVTPLAARNMAIGAPPWLWRVRVDSRSSFQTTSRTTRRLDSTSIRRDLRN